MNAWVISETPALSSGIAESLRRLQVTSTIQAFPTLDQVDAAGSAIKSAELILVAVNRIFPPHLEVVRRIRGLTRAVIVVLSSIPDHSSILHSVRAGADDFLDLAGDVLGELESLLGRLKTKTTETGPSQQLVTVIPSADPSDANTFAVNTAVLLAQLSGGCELLDFHLDGGDLAQLLSLSPRHTLTDLLLQKGNVDRAMFEQAITAHGSGVRLLAGPGLYGQLGAAYLVALERIVELARATGTVVLINAANAKQIKELRSLSVSDRVIVTTRLDLVSLSRAKQHLVYLVNCGIAPHSITVVAMGSGRRAELPTKDVQRVLGDFVVESVPDDLLAQMVSINIGEPMVLHAPKSRSSRAISRIAAHLLGNDSPATARTRPAFLSLHLRNSGTNLSQIVAKSRNVLPT